MSEVSRQNVVMAASPPAKESMVHIEMAEKKGQNLSQKSECAGQYSKSVVTK
jgi:hypothetical protein